MSDAFSMVAALRREQAVLETQLRQLRAALYLRKHAWAAHHRKYSPDQPRVPAGNPDGGQWTGGGGGSSGYSGNVSPHSDRENSRGSDAAMSFNLYTRDQGTNFIAKHEGFKPSVYHDNAGYETIGYGHKLQPGESYPDGITHEAALKLLSKDIASAETAVRSSVKVPLLQHQFDALVSLTFNIGNNAFKQSTLLRKLNSEDYSGAADQFLVWNKIQVDGRYKTDPGLAHRRGSERELFLNGHSL